MRKTDRKICHSIDPWGYKKDTDLVIQQYLLGILLILTLYYSLICRMLIRDPAHRASLEDIMCHPWLRCGNYVPPAMPLISREHLSEEDHNYLIDKMVEGNIATKDEVLQYVLMALVWWWKLSLAFCENADIKTHSSVCPSGCLSVRHQNFNLAYIFWSINDRVLIFGMLDPCDKPF